MNNKSEDNEFLEIEKKHGENYIVVVAILYGAVIILSIFLVLGIKRQKDAVKNDLENAKSEETIIEESNTEEIEDNDFNELDDEQIDDVIDY